MTADQIPEGLRTKVSRVSSRRSRYHQSSPLHSGSSSPGTGVVPKRRRPETDHSARIPNAHWLVTALLDSCEAFGGRAHLGSSSSFRRAEAHVPQHERFALWPEVYTAKSVSHAVQLRPRGVWCTRPRRVVCRSIPCWLREDESLAARLSHEDGRWSNCGDRRSRTPSHRDLVSRLFTVAPGRHYHPPSRGAPGGYPCAAFMAMVFCGRPGVAGSLVVESRTEP